MGSHREGKKQVLFHLPSSLYDAMKERITIWAERQNLNPNLSLTRWITELIEKELETESETEDIYIAVRIAGQDCYSAREGERYLDLNGCAISKSQAIEKATTYGELVSVPGFKLNELHKINGAVKVSVPKLNQFKGD